MWNRVRVSTLAAGLLLLTLAPGMDQADARDSRIRADLRILAAELPRRHVNAFHSISQIEFHRKVAELDLRIPEPTDLQAYLEMQSIVVSIGDSHTLIQLGQFAGVQILPVKSIGTMTEFWAWRSRALFALQSDYRVET
jgi:hypothetical protein